MIYLASGDIFFSVIIPTYNQAVFLQKALESVAAQSYDNYEVIVINNHSEDHTIQTVYNSQISNLTLINFRNGGSIAAARNKGVELATGDYVCFLDSDDEWYATKLEHAYNAITKSACDIYTHAEDWVVDGKIRKTKIYGPVQRFDQHALIFGSNCLSTSAVAISKQFFLKLGGFNESSEIILAEDYELWIRASLNNASCYFDKTTLGMYRIHDLNNSKKRYQHRRSELRVLELHKNSVNLTSLTKMMLYYKRVIRIHAGFLKRLIMG